MSREIAVSVKKKDPAEPKR